MDKKAAIDDVDAIYARIQELKKEREPKHCPRHEGQYCPLVCSEVSDCHSRAQAAPTTGGDGC